jgi:endo-1,4-beta-xylanase
MNVMNFRLIAAAAAGALALAGAATAVEASNSSNDSLRDLGAQVQLRIGTAATPRDLSDPVLSQITADQFSVLTPENEMKWQVVEPQQGTFNWTGADNLVKFAEAHDARVRGHTLVWHNQLPSWLTQGVANGTISDSQLRDLLHQHITTEVRRYRGRIWQWDVVNEMFTDSNPSQINPSDFWVAHLGPGVIADAFRWAKAADGSAVLCYNDYNIAGEDGSNAKFEAVFTMVQNLLAQDVPIGCVGDQGHLDLQYGFNPGLMTQDLQKFASLGLKVAIT